MKDRERDWWEEVGHDIGDEPIDTITRDDFTTRFSVEFAFVIEVQQLV
mgnify:CR=1 FL=1